MRFTFNHPTHEPWNSTKTRPAHRRTLRPTLCDKCVGSLTSHRVMNIKVLWDGTYSLSSLSEKTRKSNRLQMSLQRQHFLLSYLKTLSVGPAGIRTHDLPHGSPVLNQLSQPVELQRLLTWKKSRDTTRETSECLAKTLLTITFWWNEFSNLIHLILSTNFFPWNLTP